MDRFGRHQVRSHSWQQAHEVFETDEQTPDLVTVGRFRHDGEEATLSVSARDCVGCGVCLARCQARVFEMCNDKSFISTNRLQGCVLCRECVTCCPLGAIRLQTTPVDTPVTARSDGDGNGHGEARE
jgi:ferredoxin